MKKPLKVTLISLGTVVALVGVTLATTSIANVVLTNKELADLEPYGELVEVDGKRMNIAVFGEGDETIVLTPGAGTASPVADFAPVIAGLEDDYRIIAVEPFGYGLSDQADTPRTTDNIVREIHEAVSSVGVEEYILMGHSITGIYGMRYANTYPDEVTAFVGIDTSVPEQPGMDEVPGIIGAGPALRGLGLLRVVTALSGSPLDDNPAYSDVDRERLEVLTMRNTMGPSYLDEVNHLGENFAGAAGETFPTDLPLLLMYQANNPDFPTWNAMHEAQAATVDHGVTLEVDADHYLHHTKSAEVVAATKEFLAALPAAG
ncbi:MAG: alpha/beta hydrolase [Leucobacter sp.]|nr:alpha/beta hydrolase [Leucobacter sp.]